MTPQNGYRGISLRTKASYLLFLDESGTHDMTHVDPNFPMFVLVGLLVGETYYAKTLVPRIKKLKLRHFSSTDVILHSSDIRKHRGPFAQLHEPAKRNAFYDDLNVLFSHARVRLYAVCIDKRRLRERY